MVRTTYHYIPQSQKSKKIVPEAILEIKTNSRIPDSSGEVSRLSYFYIINSIKDSRSLKCTVFL